MYNNPLTTHIGLTLLFCEDESDKLPLAMGMGILTLGIM